MKKVFLICNAHIDPVWQWEWEEGCAAALSTFRCAADFCDEFDNFIFCHNESLLYKWVEDYEPELFARIQNLVKKGKWQIMGGWYCQPDCNMPSGESFVRQILLGREYFTEKFGKEPTSAVNFDPFGHSQGLVQILDKAGYDSYTIIRPTNEILGLAKDEADFDWIGFDDSKVRVRKANSYGTGGFGEALPKIKEHIKVFENDECICVLWGVGDHGGGPSREDIKAINAFIEENRDNFEIKHTYLEDFFKESKKSKPKVREFNRDLQHFAVGCYTSVIRIKQKHRKLENELYSTEKMLSHAWLMGLMDYPSEQLKECCEDLCFIEFHDSLPGSSVEAVEEMCIRKADHALEILSRLRAKAFFALCKGQKKAKDGEIPIIVYNPHPFKIKTQIECEFMLAGQNWAQEWTFAKVYQDNKLLPSQNEKEASTFNLDWRKKIVFEAELLPCQINRFDAKLVTEKKTEYKTPLTNGYFIFKNDNMKVSINSRTGLIDNYEVNGVKYLKNNSFELLVMNDNSDPWGMTVDRFRDLAGRFNLMSDDEATALSGIKSKVLPSLKVIEDGDVRVVIEAMLKYNNSSAVITYRLPKEGTQIEIDLRVYWNEKDKCLKLSVPNMTGQDTCVAQTAFGSYTAPSKGTEAPFQKWISIINSKSDKALSIINDSIHGFDYSKKEGLRMTLLRSSVFCNHPIADRSLTFDDRFLPRMEQGERKYRFWLNAGNVTDRLNRIERECDAVSQSPFAICFFPTGDGTVPQHLMTLKNNIVSISAVKKAEKDSDLIVRLFNPTEENQTETLSVPCLNFKENLSFSKYEIKTLKISAKGTYKEVSLIEK